MSKDSQDSLLSAASHKLPSSSGHSDNSQHPQQLSSTVASTSVVSHSSDSNSNHLRQPGSNNGLSSTYVSISVHVFSPMVLIFLFSTCSACGKPMQGPFVRALGAVFHLNCFKCMVCHPARSSLCFLSTPNRIAVMSLHPSSSRSTPQMENRARYAREITLDDSTLYVQSVEWP